LHPLRWLLCLVGLVLTGLSADAALLLFGPGPPAPFGWWQQPGEHAEALRAAILDRSLGGSIVRGVPLLAVNAMLWSLIGGWIARHELVARLRGQIVLLPASHEPGPTMFLARWWKSLLVCCPSVLIFGLLVILPVLIAAGLNSLFDGPGAVVVAVLLPVVLLADLVLLVVALGVPGWPLMAVAVAAECSDSFEALSRSYSYVYQRPIRFLLLLALALCLAGLPLLLGLPVLARIGPDWQAEGRFLLAGLSVSIFWSLQTLIYLHLRALIDNVDAGAVAVEPLPAGPGAHEQPPAAVPSSGLLRRVVWVVLSLVAAVSAWYLTLCLLRAGGGSTVWLEWGLGETFVPPTEGAYTVAAVIAGLWGVVWFGLALLVSVRRLFVGQQKGSSGPNEPLHPHQFAAKEEQDTA
jgi:hypothetical protein